MTYNPFIPAPLDLPSDSQGDILSNFNLINTFFGVDHVAFGNSIVAATNAAPAQITSPNHTLKTGATVTISSMTGTTPDGVTTLWPLNGNTYTITFVDGDNFTLNGTDTTDLTVYPPYDANSGDYQANTINYGYHKKTFFPQTLLSDPNLANPISSYYTKFDSDSVPQLFYQDDRLAANVVQLTQLPPVLNANGSGFKTPWGFIINMGQIKVQGSAFSMFSYPIPYTSTVFSINASLAQFVGGTIFGQKVSPAIQSLSNTMFQAATPGSGNSFTSIYYIAIGI